MSTNLILNTDSYKVSHWVQYPPGMDGMFSYIESRGGLYPCTVEHLWGARLKQQVIDSGATLVVRPDSGNPADVVEKCAILLERAYGTTLNRKGFKLLNHVRLIQGDGVMRPASRKSWNA